MLKPISLLTLTLTASLMLMTDLAIARGDRSSPQENTERNVRDRNDATLTPEDQSENENDRQLTAAVRRAVTDDDSLSVNAHNIKIMVRNGMVTLRGPVKTAAEKSKVQAIVEQTSGVTGVDNQLEPESP